MRNNVNLDFLRSVAVLLVVHAHYLLYQGHHEQAAWSGLTGVCMFFVHTSIVLMWSLERDPGVGHFYIRRIFRIYPLWIVMLVLILLTHLPQYPDFQVQHPSVKETAGNMLLIFNVWGGTALVGSGWTLPLEIQMYLFLPFLFFFARNSRLLWPLLLIDVFIMAYARQVMRHYDVSLLMVIPYFLPGIMAYVLSKRPGVQQLPAWAFPLFLAFVVAVDNWHPNFRRNWIFCLVLGLTLPRFRDMTWKPLKLAVHSIAKYSFGIYLTHASALVVCFYILRGHSMLLRASVSAGMFCLLPFILYHTVEEPMIRIGTKFADHWSGRTIPPH